MQVGDLVTHSSHNEPGIITHIFDSHDEVSGGVCVLFVGGEYQVDSDDLEVINETVS